jgi:hypothetical protein
MSHYEFTTSYTRRADWHSHTHNWRPISNPAQYDQFAYYVEWLVVSLGYPPHQPLEHAQKILFFVFQAYERGELTWDLAARLAEGHNLEWLQYLLGIHSSTSIHPHPNPHNSRGPLPEVAKPNVSHRDPMHSHTIESRQHQPPIVAQPPSRYWANHSVHPLNSMAYPSHPSSNDGTYPGIAAATPHPSGTQYRGSHMTGMRLQPQAQVSTPAPLPPASNCSQVVPESTIHLLAPSPYRAAAPKAWEPSPGGAAVQPNAPPTAGAAVRTPSAPVKGICAPRPSPGSQNPSHGSGRVLAAPAHPSGAQDPQNGAVLTGTTPSSMGWTPPAPKSPLGDTPDSSASVKAHGTQRGTVHRQGGPLPPRAPQDAPHRGALALRPILRHSGPPNIIGIDTLALSAPSEPPTAPRDPKLAEHDLQRLADISPPALRGSTPRVTQHGPGPPYVASNYPTIVSTPSEPPIAPRDPKLAEHDSPRLANISPPALRGSTPCVTRDGPGPPNVVSCGTTLVSAPPRPTIVPRRPGVVERDSAQPLCPPNAASPPNSLGFTPYFILQAPGPPGPSLNTSITGSTPSLATPTLRGPPPVLPTPLRPRVPQNPTAMARFTSTIPARLERLLDVAWAPPHVVFTTPQSQNALQVPELHRGTPQHPAQRRFAPAAPCAGLHPLAQSPQSFGSANSSPLWPQINPALPATPPSPVVPWLTSYGPAPPRSDAPGRTLSSQSLGSTIIRARGTWLTWGDHLAALQDLRTGQALATYSPLLESDRGYIPNWGGYPPPPLQTISRIPPPSESAPSPGASQSFISGSSYPISDTYDWDLEEDFGESPSRHKTSNYGNDLSDQEDCADELDYDPPEHECEEDCACSNGAEEETSLEEPLEDKPETEECVCTWEDGQEVCYCPGEGYDSSEQVEDDLPDEETKSPLAGLEV